MKKVWILPYAILLALLAPFTIYGQWNQEQRNEQWLFGINGGLTYQGSDIPDLHSGWGGGLTLGKTLYQQPGTPLAFDIRGRLLLAKTYGQDHIPYKDVNSNDAMNGTRQTPGSVDYSDASVVYMNNKTNIAEAGMEGVVRFNNLREKSNVHLAFFGGLGLDWYKTTMDQLDGGKNYDYSSWNINDKNRKTVLADIQKRQDGHYETMADGFGNNFGRIGLMPSLGLELGYYFTPSFALVGGHRVSFAGTDKLDGFQFTPTNDKYHYSSLGFQWTIKGKKETNYPPAIRISYPQGNPAYVEYRDLTLLAEIDRVDNSRDIQVYLNGREIKFFQFDRRKLQVNFVLRHGKNDIIIVATNDAGTERVKQSVYFEERVIQFDPELSFIYPSDNPLQTNIANVDMRLQSRHIEKREQIQLWVNGKEITSFRFDPNSGRIDLSHALTEGRNKVRAIAINEYGKAQAEREIDYIKPIVPISISWRKPSAHYLETERETVQAEAVVTGIEGRRQLQFILNGRPYDGFEYDHATGVFIVEAPLKLGDNELLLIATNHTSKEEAARQVWRKEAPQLAIPPKVDIINMKQIGDEEKLQVQADIKHVSSANQIELLINDRRVRFDFQPLRGRLDATANAKLGVNTILVRAWNNAGDASDIAYLELAPKVYPPKVEIVLPVSDPVNLPSRDLVKVEAFTQNIEGKEQISVFLNGSVLNDFHYNENDNKVRFEVFPEEGRNSIHIQVKNNAGVAEDSRTVLVAKQSLPATASLDITFPRERIYHTASRTLEILATSKRIRNKNDIQVKVNGRRIHSFSFNPITGKINAPINLQAGTNRFEITVPEEDLRDERIIIFKEKLSPPTVQITKPSRDTRTETSMILVEMEVSGIQRKDQIEIRHDEVLITTFSFDGSRYLNVPMILKPGPNKILVNVHNESGKDSDQRIIHFSPPIVKLDNLKPEIRDLNVSQPTVSPFDPENPKSRISAQILNIEANDNVLLEVNGMQIERFDLEKGQFVAIVPVKKGRNVIKLTVSNRAGSDTQTKVLNFSNINKNPSNSADKKESGPKRHS